MARCNELIVRIRRKSALNATDICGSGRPVGSLFASRLQRRTFTGTHRLAAAHSIGRVRIHRGITYFRVKDNASSYRYTFPNSLLFILKSVSLPSALSHPAPLSPPLASGEGDSLQIRLNFRVRRRVSLAMTDCVLRTLTLDRLFHMLRWSETLSLSTMLNVLAIRELGCGIRSTMNPSILITTCLFARTDPRTARYISMTLFNSPRSTWASYRWILSLTLLLCFSILLGWWSSAYIVLLIHFLICIL